MAKLIINRSGFSLVELAIVVTVIGLLIGGIVKGRSALDSARAMQLGAQVDRYKKALVSFEDIYLALPGDIATAAQDIPNCNAANNCNGGNRDGLVGAVAANNSTTIDQSGAAGVAAETTQFWKHLQLAGMISDVQVNANPANPAWGITHPASVQNTGFHVGHTVHVFNTGLWFMHRRNPTGNHWVNGVGVNATTPIIAGILDRKMDDGFSETGKMQQPDDGVSCDGPRPNGGASAVYANARTRDCASIFLIR